MDVGFVIFVVLVSVVEEHELEEELELEGFCCSLAVVVGEDFFILVVPQQGEVINQLYHAHRLLQQVGPQLQQKELFVHPIEQHLSHYPVEVLELV